MLRKPEEVILHRRRVVDIRRHLRRVKVDILHLPHRVNLRNKAAGIRHKRVKAGIIPAVILLPPERTMTTIRSNELV
jgi:hypothetical protein